MSVSAILLMLASAQSSAGEKAWEVCVDRTTTNFDWSVCGGAWIKRADAALNAEYKRLLAVADAKSRADLIAEERAWVAFRQKACALYANGEQGREGQVVHFPACLARLIERRTSELADYRAAFEPR